VAKTGGETKEMTSEPSAPGRGPGRPKLMPDHERRAMIVRTAYDMFRELGYAELSTEAVAARCHISKRTLYELFSSKAELLASVVDMHRQRVFAFPGEYDDLPIDVALERMFYNDVAGEQDFDLLAYSKFVIEEAAKYPELEQIVRQRGRDVMVSVLGDWIARQIRLGRIDVPDPHHAARLLLAMVGESVIPAHTRPSEWPEGVKRQVDVRNAIRIFLKGAERRGSLSVDAETGGGPTALRE
jgi:AcrR family transcriptional regulator